MELIDVDADVAARNVKIPEKGNYYQPSQGNKAAVIGDRAEVTKPTVESAALTGNKNNAVTQQRQQAANNYIDAANNSTSDLEKAKNLNLAAINAIGSGNKLQAARIQQQTSQRQTENNIALTQNVADLGTTIVNLLTKNTSATESQADKDQREQEEEETRQQEARAAQRRADRLAREEEEEEKREKEAEAERNRQWNTDVQLWGSYNVSKKTADVANNIKQVYYIVYERSYNTGKVRVKTYTLNRYSDGTWMIQGDMLNKISFKSYLSDEGVGQLLGAFEDKTTAIAALMHIKANVPDAVINNNFLPLNTTTPSGTDKDFWNN